MFYLEVVILLIKTLLKEKLFHNTLPVIKLY